MSETILDQFPGANLEENYQSVLAELNPGGMFEGFNVAKSIDATALAISAGIDISTGDFDTNQIATNKIIDLLGITLFVNSERFASNGAIDETEEVQGNPHRVASVFSINRNSAGFYTAVIGERGGPDNTGVMLYRVIPEPNSMILVVHFSLFMLSMNRRRRR